MIFQNEIRVKLSADSFLPFLLVVGIIVRSILTRLQIEQREALMCQRKFERGILDFGDNSEEKGCKKCLSLQERTKKVTIIEGKAGKGRFFLVIPRLEQMRARIVTPARRYFLCSVDSKLQSTTVMESQGRIIFCRLQIALYGENVLLG